MRMLKCRECAKYTLRTKCPSCKGEALPVKPPKYSPPDRWGKYRRMMKKEIQDG